MRLFVITSQWSGGILNQQSLTSIIAEPTEAAAILRHTRDGDGRWPEHFHASSKLLCVDITQVAKDFVANNP